MALPAIELLEQHGYAVHLYGKGWARTLLSGYEWPFTKRSESESDAFGAAHTSTSISAGLGMAVAAELSKTDRKVIAVIGVVAVEAVVFQQDLRFLRDHESGGFLIRSGGRSKQTGGKDGRDRSKGLEMSSVIRWHGSPTDPERADYHLRRKIAG